MFLRKTNKFDRVLWWIALGKIRYNRGNSWMNQIKDVAGLVIALYAAKSLLAEYGITFLSGFGILVLAVGQILLGYLIGYLDEKKLLLWQRENAYGSRTLNPFFHKMEESIAELHEKIDRLEKRPPPPEDAGTVKC